MPEADPPRPKPNPKVIAAAIAAVVVIAGAVAFALAGGDGEETVASTTTRPAAIASHATQCGWRAPEIYGAGERNTGYDAGEPIIASDVVRSIPQAITKLIG